MESYIINTGKAKKKDHKLSNLIHRWDIDKCTNPQELELFQFNNNRQLVLIERAF